MRNAFVSLVVAAGVLAADLIVCGPARAQTPAASSSVVVEKPTYVSIEMEVTVNRPAAAVWARIGRYCAIGEWLQVPAGCRMLSGNEGDLGAVRSVGTEVMVAKTEYSYSYAQAPRANQPFNMYHGTVEARPITPTTTSLRYSLVFDNSMLADDAAREADKARRRATFTRALNNMKTLAEGGTLPPPPAPAGGAAAPPQPERK